LSFRVFFSIFTQITTHHTDKKHACRSKVADYTTIEENRVPVRISSISSSPPTTSAPAALASSAVGPSANTATLTVLIFFIKIHQYKIEIKISDSQKDVFIPCQCHEAMLLHHEPSVFQV
jgi:hypothetical protein